MSTLTQVIVLRIFSYFFKRRLVDNQIDTSANYYGYLLLTLS